MFSGSIKDNILYGALDDETLEDVKYDPKTKVGITLSFTFRRNIVFYARLCLVPTYVF